MGGDMNEKLESVMKDDPFARSMGMELLEASPGRARVRLVLSEEHRNFLGFIHGGVIFSLLDYAFSVASNSHNESSVAVSMSVQFINPATAGSIIFAEASEVSKSKRLGLYEMTVTAEDGDLISRSDGRVFRIGKPIV